MTTDKEFKSRERLNVELCSGGEERRLDCLEEAVYCLSNGIRSEHIASDLQAMAGAIRQTASEIASYRLNSEKSVAVANNYQLRKDMPSCPRGVKVLLLGAGGALTLGQYAGERFWHQWAPLPSRAD